MGKKTWLLLVALILVLLPYGVAGESDEYKVFLDDIVLTTSYLDITYTPSVPESGLISCDLIIEGEEVFKNIFSTANRENEFRYESNFAGSEYEVSMECSQYSTVFFSDVFIVEVLEEGSVVENDTRKEEEKEGSADIEITSSDLLFALVILIALVLLFKSTNKKVDKRKNKRLRRFS